MASVKPYNIERKKLQSENILDRHRSEHSYIWGRDLNVANRIFEQKSDKWSVQRNLKDLNVCKKAAQSFVDFNSKNKLEEAFYYLQAIQTDCQTWKAMAKSLLIKKYSNEWGMSNKPQTIEVVSINRRLNELEREFNELSKNWKIETAHLSTNLHVTRNLNYLKIISLGDKVVPFILRDLEIDPRYWFEALRILTGTNPVLKEHLGNTVLMARDWVNWGRQENLIQ
jgi:hypothetical protein